MLRWQNRRHHITEHRDEDERTTVQVIPQSWARVVNKRGEGHCKLEELGVTVDFRKRERYVKC